MKLSVIVFAVAVVVAAPMAARAQLNPAQAAAIAQGVAGLIFHAMNPTPQCGPHDAMPQPYRPSTPVYSQPQPSRPPSYPSASLSDDDDDDDFQPVARHPVHRPNIYSSRQQTRTDPDEDDAAQPAQVYTPRVRQPEITGVRRRLSQDQMRDDSAQDNGSTSSGQVAEIPAQRPGSYPPQGQGALSAPAPNYDLSNDR